MPETDLTISSCGGSKIWVDIPKITADGGSAYPVLIIPATLYLNPIRKEQAEYFVISFDKCNLFLQDNSCKITDGKSNFNPYPVHSLVSIPFNIEIPQSQWIKKILPSLGYSDIWLVELPSAKKMVRVSWKYLAIGAGVFGMIKMFFWFLKLL